MEETNSSKSQQHENQQKQKHQPIIQPSVSTWEEHRAQEVKHDILLLHLFVDYLRVLHGTTSLNTWTWLIPASINMDQAKPDEPNQALRPHLLQDPLQQKSEPKTSFAKYSGAAFLVSVGGVLQSFGVWSSYMFQNTDAFKFLWEHWCETYLHKKGQNWSSNHCYCSNAGSYISHNPAWWILSLDPPAFPSSQFVSWQVQDDRDDITMMSSGSFPPDLTKLLQSHRRRHTVFPGRRVRWPSWRVSLKMRRSPHYGGSSWDFGPRSILLFSQLVLF